MPFTVVIDFGIHHKPESEGCGSGHRRRFNLKERILVESYGFSSISLHLDITPHCKHLNSFAVKIKIPGSKESDDTNLSEPG